MAKIINSQEFDNTIESGVVVVDFFCYLVWSLQNAFTSNR